MSWKVKKIKKMKIKLGISKFIGRQLSRLKMGQTYYMVAMQTLTAVGILKIVLPKISVLTLIGFCFILLCGAYFVGLLLDKLDITTMDQMKTIEMTARYLNISDMKQMGFREIQTEVTLIALNSVITGEAIDVDKLMKKFNSYYERWNPKK